jgi:hypothetical protein
VTRLIIDKDSQSSFSGFSEPELENNVPVVPDVGANVTVGTSADKTSKPNLYENAYPDYTLI